MLTVHSLLKRGSCFCEDVLTVFLWTHSSQCDRGASSWFLRVLLAEVCQTCVQLVVHDDTSSKVCLLGFRGPRWASPVVQWGGNSNAQPSGRQWFDSYRVAPICFCFWEKRLKLEFCKIRQSCWRVVQIPEPVRDENRIGFCRRGRGGARWTIGTNCPRSRSWEVESMELNMCRRRPFRTHLSGAYTPVLLVGLDLPPICGDEDRRTGYSVGVVCTAPMWNGALVRVSLQRRLLF